MQSSNRRRLVPCLAAAALVAAPLLVLFGPVLLTDRSLAMRDAGHFYHPLLEWTSQRWLVGGPPLWNPYENTGLPLLADASSTLFYPGRLLFLLPIDFAWRYKLYVAGHVALAALGAYLLARHWRASLPGGALAAISYSCCGSVVFEHANVVFLIGAAWLPFAAWATDWMLVGRSWRAAVTLGVLLALMVLGGDPQMAYHALLMAALYAAVLIFREPPRSVPNPRRSNWSLVFGGRLALIGLAAACGLLLSAVQVLPSSEAAAASDRAYYQHPRNVYEAANDLASRDGTDDERWTNVTRGLFGQPEPATHHERVFDFSVPPWRLVELIWPNIGGRMFPTHRRWMSLVPAEGRIWTPTLYLGLVPLLLALSQWRVRRSEPARVWLSWLLLLFTLGSFGWYGVGWCVREFAATILGGNPDEASIGSPVGGLYWLLVTFLPAYVNFRYPAKLFVIAALAASQLAARGWDAVLPSAESKVPGGRDPALCALHSALCTRLVSFLTRLAIVSLALLIACWIGGTWLNQAIEQGTPLGRQVAQWLARHGDSSLGPFDLTGAQRDVYFALIQTTAVCLVAAWLLRRAGKVDHPRWRWGLLVLVAVDLAIANHWLVPTAPADHWRSVPRAADLVFADALPRAEVATGDRIRVYRGSLMHWRPPSFAKVGSPDRMAQIAAWERDTLFPKYGLNHDISLVESYGSLKPVDYESLLLASRQFGPSIPGEDHGELPHPAVLRLLGAQYLVLPDGIQPAFPGKPPFATSVSPLQSISLPEDTAVWRLSDPLPRAWIVHDVEQLPPLSGRSLPAVLERSTEVLFPRKANGNGRRVRNFRETAVVETNMAASWPMTREAAAGEQCRIRRYGLHRVAIEATLAAPGLLVLGDMYAPGWTATVETNGQQRPAPVLRTNRVCRGVLLPAGEHLVRFDYRPRSFYRGVWISAAAWLALLLMLAVSRIRRAAESGPGNKGR